MRIRCPNPEHDDENPSCEVYDNGTAYCFSRCGYIPKEQLQEWIGNDYATLVTQLQPTKVKDIPQPTSKHESWRRVLLFNSILLNGPRKPREAWYYQRGFTRYTLQSLRFGHTGERFVIPFWYDGEFLGYKLRKDDMYCDPDEVKYLNPKGMPSVIIRPNPRGSPTVVVEGELDAYLLSQWGCDAVTSTSGSGSLGKDLFNERLGRQYFILTDMDDVGERAAEEVRFSMDAIRLRLPRGKDITEYLGTVEPNAVGQALRDLFRGD